MASTLMIQGTTSDAGKSILVAGLCRVLKKRGIKVAPFKPQNMALNSAVTSDGGEIGRAQAVQAQACGLTPHSDMNPVLLKPNTDIGAQVIIHGKALQDMDAQTFHEYKTIAMKAVLESHQRLREKYEVILVEGAGSPAEINLRDRDIANMGFAEAVDCPVILIADIDRGGVFAHLVGTLDLLSNSEQDRIKGFVINRFRGDISLLKSGLDWLENKTHKPVLSVLPYLHNLHIEAEDAINTESITTEEKYIKIIVPVYPRISNHTDFDPLRLHPNIHFEYIPQGQTIPDCDLIILPGSKCVRSDLKWLRDNNWPEHLQRHLRYGGKLLGICGGFQMLGMAIHDPHAIEGRIEGETSSSTGLQLMDFQTRLEKNKTLRKVTGTLCLNNSHVSGYEIHTGISEGKALSRPAITGSNYSDGAMSEDQQIIGTYFHGLFEETSACDSLLQWAGLQQPCSVDYKLIQENEINRLAECIEENMNIDELIKLLN